MQDLLHELKKIAEYHNSKCLIHDMLAPAVISELASETKEKITQRTYDFSSIEVIQLNQEGSKRAVRQYPDWSCESIICTYLKRLLDRAIDIKYPNRNNYMHLLFDIINAISGMNDFVIVKFDFKNYFNTVSSSYIFQRFIANSKLSRDNKDLFKDYTNVVPYCYAGLSTSNGMAEVIAQEFDQELIRSLHNCGVIFYKRYIDDGILIFNQYITQPDCLSIINKAIDTVFSDASIKAKPCKVSLNTSKFSYISRRDMIAGVPKEFGFLGYAFSFCLNTSQKLVIKYGITDKKKQKYQKQLDRLVDEYMENSDMELLRHRVLAYCARTVYRVNRYNSRVWKVKGFISNYNELRFYKDRLIPSTESFLKNAIFNSFRTKGVTPPYFLRTRPSESLYQLYNSLFRNRSLILDDSIGLSIAALEKKCKQVGIAIRTGMSYDHCVREYLIKVKVGH